MAIEFLSSYPSLLDRFDPRVRLAAATLLSVGIAICASLEAAIFALIINTVLLLCAGPSWRMILRRLIALNIFMLFIWIIVPLTMPGETLFTLGFWEVSRSGVHLALLVSIKGNAIAFLFITLVSGMTPATIAQALHGLGVPGKLVFLFQATYRYLHVIYEEYDRMLTAARLRGFVPGTNLHTYRTIAYMAGMLLVNSHDRSVRVYEAMLLRGFSGKFHALYDFKLQRSDLLFGLLSLTALAAIILIEIYGACLV